MEEGERLYRAVVVDGVGRAFRERGMHVLPCFPVEEDFCAVLLDDGLHAQADDLVARHPVRRLVPRGVAEVFFRVGEPDVLFGRLLGPCGMHLVPGWAPGFLPVFSRLFAIFLRPGHWEEGLDEFS